MSDEIDAANYGIDFTGASDSTSKFQTFINDCVSTGRQGVMPHGTVLLTSTIVTAGGPLRLRGVSPEISKQQDANFHTQLPHGSGTWLHFAHTGRGLSLDRSSDGSDSAGVPFILGHVLDSFGTYRDQPAASDSGTFTPINADFDVSIRNGAATIDLVMLNPSRALELYNAGKTTVRRLIGQPLINGISAFNNYDIINIEVLQFYPFWSFANAVKQYTGFNCIGIRTGRADGFFVKYGFIFQHSIAWRVEQYAGNGGEYPGGTTFGAGGNAFYTDSCGQALQIASGTDAATISFDQLACQPPDSGGLDPIFNGQQTTSILIAGNGAKVNIGRFYSNFAGASHAQVNGNYSHLTIGSALLGSWNRANINGSYPGLSAPGTGSDITVGSFRRTSEGDAMPATQPMTLGTVLSSSAANLFKYSEAPALDCSQATKSLASGASDLLPAGSGLVVISDISTGSSAVYLCSGGAVALVTKVGSVFGAPGTAGKVYITFMQNSSGYVIVNNGSGNTYTLTAAFIKTRPTT